MAKWFLVVFLSGFAVSCGRSAASATTEASVSAPAEPVNRTGRKVSGPVPLAECESGSGNLLLFWSEQGEPNGAIDPLEEGSIDRAVICDGLPGEAGPGTSGVGFAIHAEDEGCQELQVWRELGAANNALDEVERATLQSTRFCSGKAGEKGIQGEKGKAGPAGPSGKDGREVPLLLVNLRERNVTNDHQSLACEASAFAIDARSLPFTRLRFEILEGAKSITERVGPASQFIVAPEKSVFGFAQSFKSEFRMLGGWIEPGREVRCKVSVLDAEGVEVASALDSAGVKVGRMPPRSIEHRDFREVIFDRSGAQPTVRFSLVSEQGDFVDSLQGTCAVLFLYTNKGMQPCDDWIRDCMGAEDYLGASSRENYSFVLSPQFEAWTAAYMACGPGYENERQLHTDGQAIRLHY